MLAHDLLDRWAHLDSPVHRLDARVKLVCAVTIAATVLAVPLARTWLLLCHAAILAAIAALSRLPPGWIARRTAVLAPFLVLGAVAVGFVAPAGETDAMHLGALVLSRAAATVYVSAGGKCLLALLAATLLTGATTSADLLRAAQSLHVPRTLTALTGFAVTYLQVLGEEAARMITARRSRGHVRGLRRNVGVGASMIATLMVRTVERAEHIGLAMVARGYRGRMPTLSQGAVPATHLAVGALLIALSAALLWVGMA